MKIKHTLSESQKKEMAKYFMMLKKISQEEKFDRPTYRDISEISQN